MAGAIISGRQEPAPGSKRDKAREDLRFWLLANNTGGTYYDIATALGWGVRRVVDAALDLHLFDKTIVVSIPAPGNGYRVRARWNKTLRKGEANQLRHVATRLERGAVRLDKVADHNTEPSVVYVLRARVTAMEAEAAQARLLAEYLDA